MPRRCWSLSQDLILHPADPVHEPSVASSPSTTPAARSQKIQFKDAAVTPAQVVSVFKAQGVSRRAPSGPGPGSSRSRPCRSASSPRPPLHLRPRVPARARRVQGSAGASASGEPRARSRPRRAQAPSASRLGQPRSVGRRVAIRVGRRVTVCVTIRRPDRQHRTSRRRVVSARYAKPSRRPLGRSPRRTA